MDDFIDRRFLDLRLALSELEDEIYEYHYAINGNQESHTYYDYSIYFATLMQMENILLKGEMPRDDGEAGN